MAILRKLIELLLRVLFRPAAAPTHGRTLAGRIADTMFKNGYRVDEGPDEINIVYVEGMDPDGTANGNEPNRFNDLRCVIRVTRAGAEMLGCWKATTEPGRFYVEHPINSHGAARIELGQHRAWQVGMHRGHHAALVQTGGPVTVCRDFNKDNKRDGDVEDLGYFGINQHAGYGVRDAVEKASAGCLVVPTMEEQAAFMRLVTSDARYKRDRNFIFTTTILSANEIV